MKTWYLSDLVESAWGTEKDMRNVSPITLLYRIGRSRKVLYQYTNIEALLKIVSSMSLRFSRIDLVNDPLEKKPLLQADIYKRTFIACFNNSETESIPLWSMYTQRGQGVRIGFFFKENNIQDHIMDAKKPLLDPDKNSIKWIDPLDGQIGRDIYIKIFDVAYTDEAYKMGCVSKNGDELEVTPDDIGLFKSTIWQYESETRLRLYFVNDSIDKNDYNYIFVPLDYSGIDHLEIRFDPWMSEEMKECLRLGLEQESKKNGLEIKYANCDLCGRIK